MAEQNANSESKRSAKVKDYAVLKKPVITEKSSLIGARGNVVVFRVDDDASKADIKGAIERIYDVKVEAVRTMNYLGKPKRSKAGLGRRSGYRKAYVTLKEGQTIDIVEGL